MVLARMLDTPNQFAPRSVLRAFLKRCEEDKNPDPLGQLQQAMETVRGYLAKPDPREAVAKRASSPRYSGFR
jgi:hypothetical protein